MCYCAVVCGILVLQPGMEPMPLQWLRALTLDARKAPGCCSFLIVYLLTFGGTGLHCRAGAFPCYESKARAQASLVERRSGAGFSSCGA